MKIENVYDFIRDEKLGGVFLNEPLSLYTTWRIGGRADLLYQPENAGDCARVLALAGREDVPVHFLGFGSNVLIADEGLRGLVIHTKRLNMIKTEGKKITAGAGVPLAGLSQQAAAKGLSGLEFACGIPGSVGGAVIMNAGAYGSSMSAVVTRATTLSKTGERREYGNAEMRFGYRTSCLKNKGELVVEVEIDLPEGDAEESRRRMEEYLRLRKEKHPLHLPSAGSVFRNPPGSPAGCLIETAGMKGRRVGDAQVSEQHANFIVNLGEAKAAEVIKLIEEVQKEVYRKNSIWLETEVVLLGFDDRRR
ncbi:MAG: UDP-N-acetylmuramate dehydrogenase [Peptococcaceae bacterium]|nr:UDP-N-acetylmuramate dehydrogenase [Peptococcaceae bacterium]MDH7524354.1 UDP-N-acetylmuramate dehydrogenase [Peptococcaceae bacterium]